MHDDLIERDLDAGLVKGDLDLAVHDARRGEDILFADAGDELQDDAAVGELLYAQIARPMALVVTTAASRTAASSIKRA